MCVIVLNKLDLKFSLHVKKKKGDVQGLPPASSTGLDHPYSITLLVCTYFNRSSGLVTVLKRCQ